MALPISALPFPIFRNTIAGAERRPQGPGAEGQIIRGPPRLATNPTGSKRPLGALHGPNMRQRSY